MALTRPKIGQFTTEITSLTDPITVLNGGSTSANVDVGFLMNRANGLVSNVALYWNESGNTFVTAFTSNTGVTNSNIAVTAYANITTGSVLPGANVTHDLGSSTQRWKDLYLSGTTIYLGGATISSPNANTLIFTNPAGASFSVTGTTAGQASSQFGNLSAGSGVASTSATTGALQVTGGAGITGNLYVGGNLEVAGTVTFTNSVVQTQTELVLGTEIVGGNLIANSSTQSTSTTTGALVVVGGAGISGNLNVGGNISATNIFQDRGNDMNDWNTLTVMGVYLINRDSWTGTSNTPLNTLNFTGQLEVINTGNVSITQNYRPYDNSTGPNVFWTRSKYSASDWTAWVKIINGSEVMDGGSF